MLQRLFIVLLVVFIACTAACTLRMAPFSPHRSNTDAHRQATTNQACLECHNLSEIRTDHQPSDNCLRCHRIVQGD